MGSWDYKPWDNDSAADWFADLLQGSFVEKIEETLNLDPKKNYEEIRAACYVLIQLGRPYIWPYEKIVAVAALHNICDSGVYEASSNFVKEINDEISILKNRKEDLHLTE